MELEVVDLELTKEGQYALPLGNLVQEACTDKQEINKPAIHQFCVAS